MKQLFLMLITSMTILFTSCDAHKYEEDFVGIQPTHILCTDGKTYTMKQCKELSKEPIAVVFHTSSADEIEGTGYAVYLWDLAPAQFADSLNVKQNTSADDVLPAPFMKRGFENIFAVPHKHLMPVFFIFSRI